MIVLDPEAPYNFELSLEFLVSQNKGPLPYLRKNNNLQMAITVNENVIPLRIYSIGKINSPKLIVETVDEIPNESKLKQIITNFLNLQLDLRKAYQYMEEDRILKEIRNKLYGFKAPKMAVTIFEGIVKAIIQQQISLNVAYNLTANIIRKFGHTINFKGENYYAFPKPEDLANSSIHELTSCGLSRRKAEYIKHFSEAVSRQSFNSEKLRNLSPQEIINELTKFRGIGKWTAELIIAACIGLDWIPADDLGVRRAISQYYFNGNLQTSEVIRKFTEKWRGSKVVIITYLLYGNRLKIKI